jgi:hypothetical protein
MHRHGPNCTRGRRAPHLHGAAGRPASRGDRAARGRPPADAPIRVDLVKRVRREIVKGTYDTPEKWEAALKLMLEEIE